MDPQTFGRYQIVRKLAGGGMGRVFLVWDTMTNRNVGLKLIDTGNDQESLDVVAAERSGAVLQDQLARLEPGGRVAQIFDVGEREGYFYIAMEYVEGEDLSELVARGPLPAERAVRIAIDILAVLSRAHNFETVIAGRSHRGIIHGDIKPRNIRITPGGQVKVLDFGIAKAVSMTRSITFNQYGSVPYSSPERIRTGDVDARSDVWSVAVVLFEMLAGRAYFTADTSARLEVKIREYAARSRDLTTLPPGLRDILSRALDPDFARRFPSASAFEKALEEWCVGGKAALLARDPEVTRRTLPAPDDEVTRRPAPAPPHAIEAEPPAAALSAVGMTILVAASVLSVVALRYATGVWNRPETMSTKTAVQGPGPQPVAAPTKSSLLARYTAEADRVIGGYRDAVESAAVSVPDWQRAQTAVASALELSPDDPALRGKSQIIDGHLKLQAHDRRGAQMAFEQAHALLPQSPDPDLGLALVFLAAGDPVKGEDALNGAKSNGFQLGRREQRALADGYRRRGEYWLADARKAGALSRMQDSLKRATSDLSRARDFYNEAAPFLDSAALATRVSLEREHAVRVLAQARRIRPRAPVQARRTPPKPPVQTGRLRPKVWKGSP